VITSVMSFKLRREGKIRFNDQIKKYFTSYKYSYRTNYTVNCGSSSTVVVKNITYNCTKKWAYIPIGRESQNITIRQLLSHRSGIMHYDNGIMSPLPPSGQANDPSVNTGIEWGTNFFKDLPLVSSPGDAYHYSSFGYNLLGVVLSQASGSSYEKLFERVIKLPMNLTTIRADKHWERQQFPDRCVGYYNLKPTGDNDVSYKLPGGGFLSTMKDAFTFFNEVFLTEKHLNKTEKEEAFKGVNGVNYGLGFQIYNKTGLPYAVGHTGSQEKASTIAKYYPQISTVIVVMSNSEDFDKIDFMEQFERRQLHKPTALKYLE